MSKNHRGKGIIEKYRHGRGTCPICKRTGVKIVYERDVESKKMNICKICNVGLTKKEEAKKAKQAVEEPKAAAKVEVKAEVKAEPKVEVKAEVKAEPKVEEKAEVKAEPKVEEKAEVKDEAEAEIKTETEPEPETETEEKPEES